MFFKAAAAISLFFVVLYLGMGLVPSIPSPMAASIPAVTLNAPASKTLHNVRVVRTDSDGFVVCSSEGTIKVWAQQLPPQSYADLQRVAPKPTPTPVRTPTALEQPMQPTKKAEKSSSVLKELLELFK